MKHHTPPAFDRNGQIELAFDAPSASEKPPNDQADGLSVWRAERARANEELCQKLGLPINHRTEVRLTQGCVLRGMLRLAEETLWIEANRHTLLLQIDSATFRLADIESAVRTDA